MEQPLRDNKLQAKEDKEEMYLGMLIKNYQKKMTTNSKLKEVSDHKSKENVQRQNRIPCLISIN